MYNRGKENSTDVGKDSKKSKRKNDHLTATEEIKVNEANYTYAI